MTVSLAYIIYLILCVVVSVTCSMSNIYIKDIRYWIFLGCVIGAYICGTYK